MLQVLQSVSHKEDHVLFPLADAKLDASRDSELSKSFGRLEEERIGPGKHEQFHALLDSLQAFYLR